LFKESYHPEAWAGTYEIYSLSKDLNPSNSSGINFLSNHSGIYFKNYGGSGISTISMRGSSSNQVRTFWNGLPVDNPMLGLYDMTLMPVEIFDQISVLKGSNNSNKGSGAFGGVINLETTSENFDSGFQINPGVSIGGFGYTKAGILSTYKGKVFSGSTRFFVENSINNFTYFSKREKKDVRISHASYNQKNLIQDIYFNKNAQRKLKLSIWLQDAFREIPPTSQQNKSEATLRDQSLKTVFSWNEVGTKSSLHTQLGYTAEENAFQDDLILVKNRNIFHRYFAKVESNHALYKFLTFSAGITNDCSIGKTDNYDGNQVLNVFGISANSDFGILENLDAKLSLRQEWYNERMSPFIYGLRMNYRLKDNLSSRIFFKFEKLYRHPTLNELFWVPGGNSELKPEEGFELETGIFFEPKDELKFKFSIFNRKIDNWIIWGVTDFARPVYNALNLASVNSYGIESSLRLPFKLWGNAAAIEPRYSMNYAINQKEISLPEISAGDQLFYVPINSGGCNFSYKTDFLELAYFHTLYSKVLALNSEWIDGFDKGDLELKFKFQESFSGLQFNFSINNIWNTSYRVVEFRPMPGRIFMLGFNFQINQSKQ
jgi:iron complex outermembrane receptor protein